MHARERGGMGHIKDNKLETTQYVDSYGKCCRYLAEGKKGLQKGDMRVNEVQI